MSDRIEWALDDPSGMQENFDALTEWASIQADGWTIAYSCPLCHAMVRKLSVDPNGKTEKQQHIEYHITVRGRLGPNRSGV